MKAIHRGALEYGPRLRARVGKTGERIGVGRLLAFVADDEFGEALEPSPARRLGYPIEGAHGSAALSGDI
ncbi:hypothetical protein G3I76_59070 [Streptomyces sp. SID11233]|nr:hypothetical protein [Streptomyces sp. SID11233]